MPVPPALRLSAVVLALLPVLGLPEALHAAEPAAERHSYAIPPGPLEAVLPRFAAAAGIALSYDPALVAGRHSSGLNGAYSPLEGLQRLLGGSGLGLVPKASGGYSLEKLSSGGDALLREVAVTGAAENPWGGVNGYVARRNATATKTDTSLLETPQSVSVIGIQEMEDKGAASLTDALQQTAGVAVNPYGFDSRAPDWVMLRGFDGWFSSSYRDGLIQNVGMTFLGVQTEIYGLERLEVLRGPASVLFGKGDAGGVVNRVSKVPSADAPRELVLQTGSYGRQQLAADLGGALDADGTLRYRVVGLDLDSGTQEKYPNGKRMELQRQYLAPSLRWQLGPATSLVLQAEYLRDNASDDIQFVTGADGRPTSVKEGDPNYSRMKTGSDALGYQLEHRLESGWSLRQNLRLARRTMDKRHILSWLDGSGTQLERQARHDIESVDELAVDTNLKGRVQSGAVEHTLLLGVDWNEYDIKWRRYRDMTSNLSLSNPVYGVSIPDPTTLAADTRLHSEQLGVYVQDQIRLSPAWLLTAGSRRDRVRSENDDRFNASRSTQIDTATSSRLGLNYLAGSGWGPYVSYSESFVPNVGLDSLGRTFKPSEAKQVEAGVRYLPAESPFSFSAALFDLEKTGVVSYDPITFDARQIGKVRSRGLELEAKAEISPRWRLTGSLTDLDMKVLNSADPAEVGKMPILTPTRMASLWLHHSFAGDWQGFGFGVGLRHLGKRWNDVANTSSEPAYTLADAALTYDSGPWRAALNVSNLFDKHYYSGQAYGSFFRGAERNALLTLKYRF